MQFIDEAEILVHAGRGGRGLVSFHREKFRPRGGPDGGDGGRGGSVVFLATDRMTTLLDYRYRHSYAAERGADGAAKNQTGASGEDLLLPVPVGTRLLDIDGREIADLDEPGARFTLARGGLGGRGNARFATATRQAPEYAQPGQEGEERRIRLELRLIADVGLVGLPNAGKSMLIRKVSAARPRVADYPFTTLVPNLGVVDHQGRRFTVADLPGLIEGAHEGRGLGDRFLRHLSRTRVLVFLLAVDAPREPPEVWDLLRAELFAHDPDLLRRPILVALSKIDLAPPGSDLGDQADRWADEIAARPSAAPGGGAPPDILRISSISGAGLQDLLGRMRDVLFPSERKIPSEPTLEAPWDPQAWARRRED